MESRTGIIGRTSDRCAYNKMRVVQWNYKSQCYYDTYYISSQPNTFYGFTIWNFFFGMYTYNWRFNLKIKNFSAGLRFERTYHLCWAWVIHAWRSMIVSIFLVINIFHLLRKTLSCKRYYTHLYKAIRN